MGGACAPNVLLVAILASLVMQDVTFIYAHSSWSARVDEQETCPLYLFSLVPAPSRDFHNRGSSYDDARNHYEPIQLFCVCFLDYNLP